MDFDVNQLNAKNTPMRWRIQAKNMLETGQSMDDLDPNYKAVLMKAEEFADDIETGIGNQPGVGSEPDPVRVTSISLDQGVQTPNLLATVQLSATLSPANAGDKRMTWASSAPAVITVGEYTGLTTAVGTNGQTATITVTSNDGSFTDTVLFTITA